MLGDDRHRNDGYMGTGWEEVCIDPLNHHYDYSHPRPLGEGGRNNKRHKDRAVDYANSDAEQERGRSGEGKPSSPQDSSSPPQSPLLDGETTAVFATSIMTF